MKLKRITALTIILTLLLSLPCFGLSEAAYEALRAGDSGNAVRDLQQRLYALGYFSINIDARYSDQLADAVSAFETRNGLPVDGIADADMQAVLFSDEAVAAPKLPDVHVSKVKMNSNSATVTVVNDFPLDIDKFVLLVVTFDANDNVQTAMASPSLKNIGTYETTLTHFYIMSKKIQKGKSDTFALDSIFTNYDVKPASIAVGVYEYHTTGGLNYQYKPRQMTYVCNDGRMIYPEDSSPIHYINDADYADANSILFGYEFGVLSNIIAPIFHTPEGEIIGGVYDGSIAASFGFMVGDVITKFDGVDALEPFSSENAKMKLAAGEAITIELWRGGQTIEKIVSLNGDSVESTEQQSTSTSIADELLKYADLLERGAITQEEYDKLKADLIG